jgi:5'-nucleotidase
MEELSSNSRRDFLRKLGILSAGVVVSSYSDLEAKNSIEKLTILHTNDVHSRIDPFPLDGSRNAGLAGVARRAALVKQIRAEEKNVLLLDSGDIFQGTPYFNLYGGELELKLMSQLGYDAATLGNHDFDNGIEGFVKQMPHANFPFLCANYDFNNTALYNKTMPYKIFKKGNLKVGVVGVGIELEGLVEKEKYAESIYLDPIIQANKYAAILKNDEKCDLVICLSHLGYKYKERKVSDQILAKESQFIDLIIGAHTHTFMSQPENVRNAMNEEVKIFQVGFAGINLGRVDYYFEKSKKKKNSVASSLIVNSNYDKV